MATRISSLENVNSTGERVVLQYDATLDRFKLVDIDDILAEAAEDGDISDTFITQVEEQITVENIQVVNLDAGSF